MSSSRDPLTIRLILVFARGVYGILCSIIIHITSLHVLLNMMLKQLIYDISIYLVWIILFILYMPSILIAKFIGAKTKTDLYLRGITVYFSLAVLTHIMLTS
ncbi:MAG: hypothetical protein N3E36_07085 [Sulfolobales archaeon]|nr:hypothetical protein [Ignisphaera sp.]MCX8199756.1 hypothetical protein [Sulfolobales archaeon]